MTARKRKSALTDRKASVILERNGACIRVDDVPAAEAGLVLADMLEVFRLLQVKYPELVRDLEAIGGGPPIDVIDDDYADQSKRKRRLGFTIPY